MDSIKAYNSLLPLVTVLPQQDQAALGELAINVTSSVSLPDSRHVQPFCSFAC